MHAAAPGYRNVTTGEMTAVGNNGYSWSSTVSGTNALRLNFNYDGLNPSNANNRGYGFQLRCLQAFIGRPVFLIRSSGCFAPGNRYSTTGELYGVGSLGFGWSSLVTGIHGVHLDFHSTYLYSSSANHRSYGFPVRCLQAFIGRPVFLIRSSGCFAPGYRHPDTGVLGSVGSSGYSWALSVDGIYALGLGLGVSWHWPSAGSYRSQSFQVRCLQAFIGRPVFYPLNRSYDRKSDQTDPARLARYPARI